MEPAGPTRELFRSRAGFILASVGSAVGLGNMWRFSYQAAEGGGAAFVGAYVAMVFLIGVPMLMAELAVGRHTHRSGLGAVRAIGGRAFLPLGVLFTITSLTILAYLSVITGWAIRYALEMLVSGPPSAPVAHFDRIASGGGAVTFHLVSMAATVGIVVFGVRKGIERASMILMPMLFVLLVGLAVWAATLSGASDGYRFYLSPSLSAVLDPVVLQGAAAQAFYSLSLGMGIMITYASYHPSKGDLGKTAAIIALSDFSVALVAGLVVFPIVFALGLSGQIGASAMGVLFIALPSGFADLGATGRLVGVFFFSALVVAAVTSAVSLLEVVTATLIDEMKMRRRAATLTAGAIATAVGIVPALYASALGNMDQIAAELFTVVGVLGVAILVGWVMRSPLEEFRRGASPGGSRVLPAALFLIRYVWPLLLAFIAWTALRQTLQNLFG